MLVNRPDRVINVVVGLISLFQLHLFNEVIIRCYLLWTVGRNCFMQLFVIILYSVQDRTKNRPRVYCQGD